MKKKLLILILALVPSALFAQTPAMLAMAQGELQKRGLTETEVRARLLQKGINVDTIDPSQYADYQGQVMATLDELEAEKKAGVNAVASDAAVQAGPSTLNEIPASTAPETDADREIAATQAEAVANAGGLAEIYGHSLFTGQSLEVFRTTNGAEAPDTYILDEGDEVHISIFGASQTEIHQRIGPDGSIQPVGSNKIFLKGMTLAQGRTAIRNNMAAHYSFRQDQIAVTITTARTITVNIYGEVGTAGGFTLSALNTAFNALAAAGGPSSIGTVRNIQLIRGGKASVLDLYSFMDKPDPKASYDIRNNDIIFVPVAQKIVSVEGAVNRPMRYEMKDGETLSDLIRYAGGLTYNVNTELVQIERFENGEPRYLEYNLGDVMNGRGRVSLENGDIVRIRTATKPLENYVSVEGGVYYGGNYDLGLNSSLSTLLEKAVPNKFAKKDYVFVERTRDDETVEVLTVPYPGENGNPDFKLASRDVVRVLEQAAYRDVATIEVAGQVRRPFSREFGLNDSMTIGQAIEYAGGLRESVYPVAYIVRTDQKDTTRREYVSVDLEKDGGVRLQPGDVLNVYDNSTYSNNGELRISGAVKRPFSTPFDASMSLHDLIVMAGGFETGAAYDRVEVFRTDISKTNETKLKLLTLTVDGDYNTVGKDFQLQPFDHVVVRMTPNFTTGRTVEISGRVKYPGAYVIEDDKTTLTDIIARAGGMLDDADPFAWVFRTYNNRGNIAVNLKNRRRFNPILMDGDVINITRKENVVVIKGLGTRMDQYSPEGFEFDQVTVVYQGPHTADWYIRNYAGGFQRAADRRSVTVTMPNNQMLGTRSALGLKSYPIVEPGGTINLQMDPKKQEQVERPKEKVDWGSELSKSLSTLTSAISMIAIISRLY